MIGGGAEAVMLALANTGEASLIVPLLISCCAAQFLIGGGPVPICSPGAADPWFKEKRKTTDL